MIRKKTILLKSRYEFRTTYLVEDGFIKYASVKSGAVVASSDKIILPCVCLINQTTDIGWKPRLKVTHGREAFRSMWLVEYHNNKLFLFDKNIFLPMRGEIPYGEEA